jgi:hypothetical protein
MTLENITSKPVSLFPYFLQFMGIYAFCALLVGLIAYYLNFDVPSSMGIILLVVTTSVVVQNFVRKYERALTSSERWRFAGFAVLANILLTIVFAAAFLGAFGISLDQALLMLGLPFNFLALIGLFSLIVTGLVVYFSSGFMGRQAMKKLEKAKTKQ